MKKISLFRAAKSRCSCGERSEPIGERSRSGQVRVKISVAMLLLALILSACTSVGTTPTAIPTVSLDNNNSPSGAQSSDANSVSASAFIVPLKQAELSFANVGRVKAVDVTVGDQVEAGQVLVELDTTLLEAKVREAEANLTAAQVEVKYLKRVGTDEVHLESAQAEADRAQALLDSAQATLAAQSTLVAPFEGTIALVDVSSGETVVPGGVVITMGDLSRFQVETEDLSERDVPRVQIGQNAGVFIEALNQEFSGKVTDISRVSSTVGGDVVFEVTIDLDQQPQGLLWGMSADVKIETGRQE
ncbi:MAG: efflux RND transporter periplasmic adaptor subunit [Chloroflexi bacterium]|nr:MAG: efflux RND transporter periplasmic adaptor subunit [Chloroflexota bacterium]